MKNVFIDLLKRVPEPTQEISVDNLKTLEDFIFKVLGGVPRYLELLAWVLGEDEVTGEFSWVGFRDSLVTDKVKSHHLLERVVDHVEARYDKELGSILGSIPHKLIVGYSLFELENTKVEDLERGGVVFLQSVPGKGLFKLVFPLVLMLRKELPR